jgi:hypothetical protein
MSRRRWRSGSRPKYDAPDETSSGDVPHAGEAHDPRGRSPHERAVLAHVPDPAPPTEGNEWLEPPKRILVRQRQRLGGWYWILRPLAILFAILFRALREVLAMVVWIGLWAFWLISHLFAWALFPPLWVLKTYVRLRYGSAAAEELQLVEAQADADGRAWRERATARFARRLGWSSDSDTVRETPGAGSEDRP